MTRTMHGVEDFLRLDMLTVVAGGVYGAAGAADCVDKIVVFG